VFAAKKFSQERAKKNAQKISTFFWMEAKKIPKKWTG